jgi:hypothetical protein
MEIYNSEVRAKYLFEKAINDYISRRVNLITNSIKKVIRKS